MPPAKLNILNSAQDQIDKTFDPHIVGDINDYQVKVAKFGEVFDWHSHDEEDEGFLVLKGRIAIDYPIIGFKPPALSRSASAKDHS